MQNEEPLIIQNNLLNQQEEIEELNLDYQNYQVVPAEYFAHLFEPSSASQIDAELSCQIECCGNLIK